MSRLNKIFVILAVLAVSASAQQSGWLSRYWDGCKPSCSWSDKQQHHGGAVAKECRNNNMRFNPTSDANSSSCDGGTSYTCWDMAPWAASATLSYGFVASHNSNDCGKCFELSFTGEGNWDGSWPISNKKMQVMVSNCGGDVGNMQFDLLIPGGGVGQFDSFNWQLGNKSSHDTRNGICSTWPSPSDGVLGARCGGLLVGFCENASNKKTCLANKCQEVFGGAGRECLLQGCLWHAEWLEAADNPKYTVTQMSSCPQILRDVYTGAATGPCTGPNYGGIASSSSSISSSSSSMMPSSSSRPPSSSSSSVALSSSSRPPSSSSNSGNCIPPTNGQIAPPNGVETCIVVNGKCYICNPIHGNECLQSWLWTGAQVDQSYWFTEINCSTGGTSSSSSSVVPSSSSRQPSSSSSANTTPIITNRENPLIGIIGVQTIYYNLKGEPLGTQKPTTPGLYLVKNTKTGQIQKIIVR